VYILYYCFATIFLDDDSLPVIVPVSQSSGPQRSFLSAPLWLHCQWLCLA